VTAGEVYGVRRRRLESQQTGGAELAVKTQALEEFVLERMDRTKLSAVSLAVVRDGRIEYERGFGLRDREAGLAATPRTNYCIGSVTKSFTCLAIMQLQERGLLQIDDPVEQYLPLTIRPAGEPVRLHHLMSHTSGIPALAYLERVLRYHHGAFDTPLTMGGIADMITFVNGAEGWESARPGERWFYLNEGYVMLGAVIEQLTGRQYRDYVQEEICLPLGMTRTYHHRELFEKESDTAVPYAVDREGRHLPKSYTWGQAEADGGLISNPVDMARYIGLYLDAAQGAAQGAAGAAQGAAQGAGGARAARGGGGVIGADSLREMMKPAVATPPEDVATGEPVVYYGLGLNSSRFFGRRLVGHSGLMYVATAAMRMLPEERLGVIVQANGNGYPMANIADFALALWLGEDPWQLPALRTEATLEQLTGLYETYRGTYPATVRREGDFLILEFKNNLSEETVPLVPVDLNPERPRFLTLRGGYRLPVAFVRREGATELFFERYLFRRVGKLPD
jgi:CubicO group peptidase (beta-lactamase class C family)